MRACRSSITWKIIRCHVSCAGMCHVNLLQRPPTGLRVWCMLSKYRTSCHAATFSCVPWADCGRDTPLSRSCSIASERGYCKIVCQVSHFQKSRKLCCVWRQVLRFGWIDQSKTSLRETEKGGWGLPLADGSLLRFGLTLCEAYAWQLGFSPPARWHGNLDCKVSQPSVMLISIPPLFSVAVLCSGAHPSKSSGADSSASCAWVACVRSLSSAEQTTWHLQICPMLRIKRQTSWSYGSSWICSKKDVNISRSRNFPMCVYPRGCRQVWYATYCMSDLWTAYTSASPRAHQEPLLLLWLWPLIVGLVDCMPSHGSSLSVATVSKVLWTPPCYSRSSVGQWTLAACVAFMLQTWAACVAQTSMVGPLCP